MVRPSSTAAAGRRPQKRRASDASTGDGPSESSTLADAAYFCLIGLLMAVAISKMVGGHTGGTSPCCTVASQVLSVIGFQVTGNWLFGYEKSRWMKLRTWMPVSLGRTCSSSALGSTCSSGRGFAIQSQNMTMTPEELLKYDGSDPNLPLYLAVQGQIFDVSEGRRIYAPGGSYHVFAGRDCARGYATGCFKQDCTYDLRGLSEKDVKVRSPSSPPLDNDSTSLPHRFVLQKVEGWQRFYNKHDKYFRVGTLLNPPIDPDSPEPEPCGKK